MGRSYLKSTVRCAAVSPAHGDETHLSLRPRSVCGYPGPRNSCLVEDDSIIEQPGSGKRDLKTNPKLPGIYMRANTRTLQTWCR